MWKRTLWNLQLHKIFSEQTELSGRRGRDQGREIDSCTGKRENGENVKILQKKGKEGKQIAEEKEKKEKRCR